MVLSDMEKNQDISILLLSGYTPRRDAIENILIDVCGESLQINKLQSFKEVNEKGRLDDDICLMDLANVNDSSMTAIQQLRHRLNNTKLIAIHIYQSKLLIDPLFDAGIEGYLFYDLNRQMISDALNNVLLGKKFHPLLTETE